MILIHDSKNPYKVYILFTPCITIFYNMKLNYIYLQNYLQKFLSSKFLLIFCFRLDRPTGPVDRHLHRTCTLVHVCRPTARVDRLSGGLLLGFLGRPPGRPPSETCVSFRGRSTQAVDPSPTATASRADGRPDGSTAKPAEPQRLSLIHI